MVGLGFGGWIAAEMATMAPAQTSAAWCWWARWGSSPSAGEILDQALVSYVEYVRAGFHDPAALERVFGAELPTPLLEQWDVNRETTFRIAWRPYMYNPTLPAPARRREDARARRVGRGGPHRAARVRRALRQGPAPTHASS